MVFADKTIVSECSVISTIGNQLSSVVDEELVILDCDSEVYYGLNKTGALIWQAFQENSASVSDILATILAKYTVDPEQCKADLLSLLQQLLDAGLIEVSDGAIA